VEIQASALLAFLTLVYWFGVDNLPLAGSRVRAASASKKFIEKYA
jgi:hypothetical protein